jgi:hypothetical protein
VKQAFGRLTLADKGVCFSAQCCAPSLQSPTEGNHNEIRAHRAKGSEQLGSRHARQFPGEENDVGTAGLSHIQQVARVCCLAYDLNVRLSLK